MGISPKIEKLIRAFSRLPGIGPKSAQRLTLHLLAHDREAGTTLGTQLLQTMEGIGHCQHCQNFTEHPLCELCENPRRDPSKLCIVESSADLLAIEHTGYRGHYFVLHGHLSPIDGIGPEQLGIKQLLLRARRRDCQEVIFATNATVEGDATAHYIAQQLHSLPLKVTRIAHGIPMGGELEYLDGNTLSRALASREVMES